jgi:UbiD family decarboxylase
MIHDKKSVGFYISPGKHGRIQRDKYEARNEPMPLAIVVGCDPMSFLMASSEVPCGVCEYDVIGGIRGTPVDVVKAPITGLPVPANAEIVIGGYVRPGNVKPEGPFGEWMGYYGSDVRNEPVMDIKAIYHRNNPILSAAHRSGRPTRLAATARSRARRSCARMSPRPACPTSPQPGRTPAVALDEHRSLVQAIERRDGDQAEQVARAHRRQTLTLRRQMILDELRKGLLTKED